MCVRADTVKVNSDALKLTRVLSVVFTWFQVLDGVVWQNKGLSRSKNKQKQMAIFFSLLMTHACGSWAGLTHPLANWDQGLSTFICSLHIWALVVSDLCGTVRIWSPATAGEITLFHFDRLHKHSPFLGLCHFLHFKEVPLAHPIVTQVLRPVHIMQTTSTSWKIMLLCVLAAGFFVNTYTFFFVASSTPLYRLANGGVCLC